jgi:prepilin-type N-terminal cleavage/methylation domain-containing protein
MKKSFTLIEILVVVFIIGLLASLVIVNLNQARAKGRDAKRISDLTTVASALQAYYADNHKYPPHTYSNYPYSMISYINMVSGLKKDGYLASCPQDPKVQLTGDPCDPRSYPSTYGTISGEFGYRYQAWIDNSNDGCSLSSSQQCNYYALAAKVELDENKTINDSLVGGLNYRLCNGEPWYSGNCAPAP